MRKTPIGTRPVSSASAADAFNDCSPAQTLRGSALSPRSSKPSNMAAIAPCCSIGREGSAVATKGRRSSKLMFFCALSGANWFKRPFWVGSGSTPRNSVLMPVGVTPTRLFRKRNWIDLAIAVSPILAYPMVTMIVPAEPKRRLMAQPKVVQCLAVVIDSSICPDNGDIPCLYEWNISFTIKTRLIPGPM